MLWCALRLDALYEELLRARREREARSEMASVLVIARLCEPSSEPHITGDWCRRTALEDLLGLPNSVMNVARLEKTGRWSLIGTPMSELKKWSREIAEARD